jgi:uncharacterized protein (DUF58 family)
MTSSQNSSLLDPALLERVKGLSLVARRVVEGVLHGLHRSPLHGLSIEFAQHRQYTPGDELKRLDWRVLARSDRYVIKQYEQETNMRVVLLVDCSRSMAFDGHKLSALRFQPAAADVNGDSKFQYARVLAAALGYLLLSQGDSVGLMLTNYRVIEQLGPRAAPGHILSLCQLLETATPSGPTDLAAVIGQLAARLTRRSLVIVISDLLDQPEHILAGLGQLTHRGHEVLVLQVLDPRELEFDLGVAGRGVTVIRDMETGAEFEAEPLLVRELVRAEIARFCARLDAGARAHGVHLHRCPTDVPVERALTQCLAARMKGRRV